MNTKIGVTITWIQENLPLVQVQIGKYSYNGKISGRKNKFATVTVELHPNHWVDYQFSWEAIQNHLNSGRPLKV